MSIRCELSESENENKMNKMISMYPVIIDTEHHTQWNVLECLGIHSTALPSEHVS